GRDRRHPDLQRLLVAGLGPVLADARADHVVAAARHHRPAVVQATPGRVDLVAALRPVLDGPQRAAGRVGGGALDVAVAQAPDIGCGELRVGGGRAALAVDADHLAEVVGRVLRVVLAREAVAQADPQRAVAAEDDARAAVQPA